MSIDITVSKPPASADERLADNLRSELLIAKEMLKEIASSLRALEKQEGSLVRKHVEEVINSKKRVELLQHDFLTYFSKVAATILNKDEWMGIFSKISGILDKISGVAYRIEHLHARPSRPPTTVYGKLAEMTSLLASMIDDYIAMMNHALTNPGKALEYRGRISAAEAEMDFKYRDATFTILEQPSLDPMMLLLLDVAEMLEDIADLLNSASDDLYLVALSIS